MGKHTKPLLAIGGLNATQLTVTRRGAPNPPRDAYRVTVAQTSSGHPSTR